MVSVPGVPLAAGFSMTFGTKSGAGAILITAGEVKQSQLKRDLEAFKWVTEPQNMQKLLQDWEEISKEKRTLWVITGTYSAKSCALSVLSSSEASAVVGIEANVADVDQAKPTVQWWKQDTDKTWIKYKDVSSSLLFPRLCRTDIRRILAWCCS
jgi:molybdopterin synthase catalytic subunit